LKQNKKADIRFHHAAAFTLNERQKFSVRRRRGESPSL